MCPFNMYMDIHASTRILKQPAVEAFRHMQIGGWRAGLVRIFGRMNGQLACTGLAVGASHDFSLFFASVRLPLYLPLSRCLRTTSSRSMPAEIELSEPSVWYESRVVRDRWSGKGRE